ncbi:hypothetical protein FGB62_286g011 [Gracilaria domingensis]|nr:hypothetical protein FGB62_286g015 [Gracilaria domingensis]KAI0557589.1 hypothetical protein FGB62_286g013 [Gracilaria domingensis]KAI0557591.1 hypothetical protein FGB62_286g011 [Gracilaria domingensis]
MSKAIVLDIPQAAIHIHASDEHLNSDSLIYSEALRPSRTPSDTFPTTDDTRESSYSLSSPYCVVLVGFAEKLHSDGQMHGMGSANSSISALDTHLCELPWGGKVTYYGFGGETYILLPPFSEVIGRATSLDTLGMGGTSVVEIPYGRNVVNIGRKKYVNATHLAFRNLQPMKLCRFIARRVAMVGGNSNHKQICESGPVLKKDCMVVDPRQVPVDQTCMHVVISSPEHRLVENQEISNGTLHGIPTAYKPEQLDKILERISYQWHGNTLNISSPALLLSIVLLGAMFWMLLGFLQWLGSEDSNWASIINECIGTGSVLLGVILYFSRKFFSRRNMRSAFKGKLHIQNDLAAKLFAPSMVRELQAIACHPNLPSGLVAKDSNSCVRVRRDGWLRIGKKVPVREAGKHGYYVLKTKGLVLDLYQAKIYKLARTEAGNVRILREEDNQEEWTEHVVPDTSNFL